jgi:hypothetical protein
MIGLPGQTIASLQAAGYPIPPPLQARGVIDTGTDVTAIARSLLHQMGLRSVVSATTHTARGSARVNLFEISLTIQGSPSTAGVVVVRPLLQVMELTTILPGVDVLIGRDVLDECLLVSDGPGKQFILAS